MSWAAFGLLHFINMELTAVGVRDARSPLASAYLLEHTAYWSIIPLPILS